MWGTRIPFAEWQRNQYNLLRRLKSKGIPTGVPFALSGRGWNDVPRECSTRRAPARRSSRKRSRAGDTTKAEPVDTGLSVDKNIEQYTQLARTFVLEAWPGIVQGLIQKARSGGYQQAKLLLDLCDLTKLDSSSLGEEQKRQLCDVLLEGLGLSSIQVEEETAKMDDRQKPENTETL